jgi:hypothetical protein
MADNGVDHLHFCLDDNVDSSLTANYFWSRPLQATAQSSVSDGLSAQQRANMRATLLYNLYGQ